MGLTGIKPLGLCVGALCALLVVWVDRATAGPLAASLGPEAPLAEPIGGYLGKLEVSPTHGPSGTSVTVTAENLPPNQEFQLVWRTVRGHWNVGNAEYHGREYKPVAYEIARLRSDEAGRLSANFPAPDDFGFSHDVVLQQGSRLLTQAGFSIDMRVKLTAEAEATFKAIETEERAIVSQAREQASTQLLQLRERLARQANEARPALASEADTLARQMLERVLGRPVA